MNPLEAVEPLTASIFGLTGLFLLTFDAKSARLHGHGRQERWVKVLGWAYVVIAAAMAGALASGVLPWGLD